MKIIINYRSIVLVTIFSLIVAACGESTDSDSQTTSLPAYEAQPTLKLSSAALDVNVGNTFTLDIGLDAFPVTEGGGINIGYSSDVIQVKEVLINSETWSFATQQGAIDNSAGLVSNILVSSYQDVVGKAVLATITFEAVAAGSSDITLSESTVNPFASAGTRVNPLFINSHVTVR